MQVETFTRFTDNSGRAAYSNRETFIRDNSQTSVTEDCLDYNPNNLSIRNEGANGWLLTDGNSRMFMLYHRNDATLAKQIAESNSRQCFIGPNNTRPNRQNYIIDYWQ